MRTLPDAVGRGDVGTIYVHLCLGGVVELHPASSVKLTQDLVVILNEEEVVSSFPRESVYFVADEPMEPSSL